MRKLIFLGSIAALAACGSSSTSNISCGDGTMLVGDSCEPTGSGGGGDTCGTGTHLDGTTCVPDGQAAAGAPTIASMDPTDAGVSGFVLFTITGTNFAGSDVSGLHVFFGDITNANCEAQVGTATATTIAGEVPPACDLHVTVTVQTNKGSATIPFQYDALFAADGDGGGNVGQGGNLYVIDPFALVYFPAGPLVGTDMETQYALSGIAFDSAGTFYGVTSGDSPADDPAVYMSQLVTLAFDPINGLQVTPIGPCTDGLDNNYYVSDIKMSGTTLYGWAYRFGETVTQILVTIDTAHGTVTPVGDGTTSGFNWEVGGMAIDANQTIHVAANGAAAGGLFNATGELDTVSSTTGDLTPVGTLDWNFGSPVEAMEYVGTDLYAVIDDGTYGAQSQSPIYGETLALIDTTQNPIVQPLIELPAQPGAQSSIDAIAMAPAAFSIARQLKLAHWSHLNAAGSTTGPTTARVQAPRHLPLRHVAPVAR